MTKRKNSLKVVHTSFLKQLKGKLPLNIGTFIFGAIFLYMMVSLVLYLTADHIEAYQVTAGPLAQNQTYTAFALREETVVTANASGYITYYVRENTKVSKDAAIYTLG